MTTPVVEWIRQNPIMNTVYDDAFSSIVSDASGNIYISYVTYQGTASGQTNIGNSQDIVVFKMNPMGTVEWVRQNNIMNTRRDDTGPSISVDNSGNVYISYATAQGTASGQTNTGNSQDIIVFKMNPTGAVEWVRQNNIMNTSRNDTQPSISVDNSGNVYISYATFQGTASGQTNTGNSQDIVVFKMNPMGAVEWVRQNNIMNTSRNDTQPSITVDDSGNVYISYATAQGTASGQTNTGNSADIVVFKMNPSGNVEWIIQNNIMNTINDDYIPNIIVDNFGNVYVSYDTEGNSYGNSTTGLLDIVIFKIRQVPNALENTFGALLQDYITLGPTLVFTPEYVTALRDGKPLPSTALVDWIPPTGLPAKTPLRDLKKSIVTMQNRLHTYRFRYMQEISGPTTEGVDPLRCGYVCTWAASGHAYLP
jgi:phage-related protein